MVAALVVHAFGMKVTKRTDGGADFETVRVYDVKKHNAKAEEYGAEADKLLDELDAAGLEERKIKGDKK